MENFSHIITLMNVNSSRKLFLAVGAVSLLAMGVVIFLKRKK
ncbi:LPXTG cell wall anchor domain-containing protein [uncultured Parvimonas sp.]|nr:LPXTG cell wall anchor domain-containing protein [uncultured Parvimonas sp.]